METARQCTETGQLDDRRIDQVVNKLERYRLSVAALQETSWFNDAMYKVGESIVPAAGRPTPFAGEATVYITWFSKKEIHKHTWQNPKTIRGHCIDFAVMQQRDRRCLDACMKRGVECNTDHQLLRIKMRLTRKGGYHQPRPKKCKTFDVLHLTGRDETRRHVYRERVRLAKWIVRFSL